MLSVTSETGEIAVLNRDGHAQLSHDTIALVEKALECADLTNGAFDPTLLPLKNLCLLYTSGRAAAMRTMIQDGNVLTITYRLEGG